MDSSSSPSERRGRSAARSARSFAWKMRRDSGVSRTTSYRRASRCTNVAPVFQADAMRLPFADDTFDHVFMSHVISVVSDPYKLIQEAQRVARPGARLEYQWRWKRALSLVSPA